MTEARRSTVSDFSMGAAMGATYHYTREQRAGQTCCLLVGLTGGYTRHYAAEAAR